MNKLLICLITVSIVFSCQTQKKETKKIDHPTQSKTVDPPIIGFGCFADGSETNPVQLFSKLLSEKNYTEVKNRLYHSDPAEKYLATIVCLRLQEKKLIELSKDEEIRIKTNKQSKDIVELCSGCTEHDELTVRELFDPEWNSLYEETENWLTQRIP